MFSPVCLLAIVLIAYTHTSALELSGKRHQLFERLDSPKQWKLMHESDSLQSLTITLALKQNNLDLLEQKFNAVSDPSHPDYGNYMSRESINALIAPRPVDIALVTDWLHSVGIDRTQYISYGDAISVKTSVKLASTLFQTRFYNFVDTSGHGRVLVRQMGVYSIPAELRDIVQLAAGVSDFPMPRPSPFKNNTQTHTQTQTTSDPFVVPQTISTMYNIPSSAASSAVSQSVAEFQGDSSYSKSDLALFYKQTDTNTLPVSHTIGPFQGDYPDIEATLDIQYITSVGVNAQNWYWTESNWMYDFSVAFFNSESVPDVVSMSWGWSESAQCDISSSCSTLGVDSETYVERTNTEFMKIGARGVTLVASSGDSGANGRTNGQCFTHKLFPIFPAGSPYVTAVGATQISNAETSLTSPPPVCASISCASGGTEVAVSHAVAGFTSGGGFSNYVGTPAYQKKAVNEFLTTSTKLPPSSYFNASGRGYPDIAALGNKFLIYANGESASVGGTSASAPTIAGIVSVLNSARLKSGQSKLGFINPFLYKMHAEDPSTFNDVVSGSNICTEDGCGMFCKGFTAEKGWDPVTGLGTPNVGKMIEYIQRSAQPPSI